MPTPFTPDDLLTLQTLVETVVAEQLMPRFRHLQAGQVHQKTSGFDIVTEADEATEAWLSMQLRQRFVSAHVIGEESSGRDPSQLTHIAHADLAFIIDPLDGTKNFASGLPLFGVMVAVVQQGVVVASLIHDPITRSTAQAMAGAGAWMQEADGSSRRLQVASAVPLDQIEGIAGTNFLPEPARSTVNRNLSKLMMTNWFRCAAHEYRLAAAGHLHILFYNKLMPWDHAAGWLLHREAGGYSAHFDGSAYRPFHLSGGLLCAPDHASWQQVRDALLGP